MLFRTREISVCDLKCLLSGASHLIGYLYVLKLSPLSRNCSSHYVFHKTRAAVNKLLEESAFGTVVTMPFLTASLFVNSVPTWLGCSTVTQESWVRILADSKDFPLGITSLAAAVIR